MDDEIRDALAMIARHVQAFLGGNRRALHELCDVLTSGRYSDDTVDAALEAIVDLAVEAVDLGEKLESEYQSTEGPSAERLPLSPEAYMYLIQLRRSGAISTVAEEVLMERVSATASEEVTLEDLKQALAEVSRDPLGSMLPSPEEGDPPTVH